MMAFHSGSRGLLSRALLAGLLSACGGGDLLLPGDGAPEAPEAPAPTSIRVFDGNAQSGQVGEPLLEPLVVLVTDAEGNPVEGAAVEFELTSAGDGAQVAPATVQTNASGLAEAQVVLGDKVGLQTGEARVVAISGLTTSFSAFARTDSHDNHPPDADFEVHCSGLICAFVDKSKDDDGAVVAWQWSFGDGASSSERNPVHTYAGPGKYEVLLIVTDDRGDIDAKDHEVDPKSDSDSD
jgi:PKD repeat protein